MKANQLLLLLIIIMAVGFRLFYSTHHGLSNDEAFFLLRGVNYLSVLPISTIDQMPLYFMLLDLGYSVFGVYPWVGRLWLSLFTILICLLLYYIGKKMTSESGGLLSALVFAASPFVLLSQQDADLLAITFVLLAVAASFLQLSQLKKAVIMGICLGIGALIKIIVVFFIPVVIFLLWNHSKRLRDIAIMLGIIGIISFPILLHNVLWFMYDGNVDIPLAGLLGMENHQKLDVSMAYFQVQPFEFLSVLWMFFKSDFLFVGLGFLGLLGLSIKNQKLLYLWFLPLLLIPFFSTHPKHFVFLSIGIALCSSGFLYVYGNRRLVLGITAAIAVGFFVFFVPKYIEGFASLTTMNVLADMRSEFVIIDARIYPALMPLVVDPLKHVSTSSILDYYVSESSDITLEKSVVVVSCESGVCARSAQDFTADQWKLLNYTIKQLVKNTPPLITISDKQEQYAIYQVQAALHSYLFNPIVDLFYGYPIGWVQPQYAIDFYPTPDGLLRFIYYVAKIVLWIALVLCVLMVFISGYLIFREES